MAMKFLKFSNPVHSVPKTAVSESIAESTAPPEAVAASETSTKPIEPAKQASRKRGSGETVALSFRVPKDAWIKLHQVAMCEGGSLQSLIWQACSEYLVSKGQPPL
jgi:hypothetical protein